MPSILQGFPSQNGTYIAKDSAAITSHFMSKVYRWMMFGILITALVAHAVSTNQSMVESLLMHKGVFLILMIAQLGAVLMLSAMIGRLSYSASVLLYLTYAALTGITFSVLLLVYTQNSVESAFFVTAIAFGGLSMIGYFTKKNLGPIGTFCGMALFGLIGMMLLAIFIPSLQGNGMQTLLSVAGILIFSGLTAYDTQRLKQFALDMNSTPEDVKKRSIQGALMLYLDFINLFLSILRLMGNKR